LVVFRTNADPLCGSGRPDVSTRCHASWGVGWVGSSLVLDTGSIRWMSVKIGQMMKMNLKAKDPQRYVECMIATPSLQGSVFNYTGGEYERKQRKSNEIGL
jgi:hypothetical protein